MVKYSLHLVDTLIFVVFFVHTCLFITAKANIVSHMVEHHSQNIYLYNNTN